MIATMGCSSGPLGSPFGSPLKLQSSLFVTSRRPSIPLSPTLLPLTSFASLKNPDGDRPLCFREAKSQSPVAELPVEILCDIFFYCDAEPTSPVQWPKVTISHVCRRWRTIILCMPLLWSCIDVPNTTPNTIERANTFFRRAGSCLISLSVKTNESPSQHLGLWSIIRSRHRQLKSLQLTLSDEMHELVDYFSGCQFQALKTLDASVSRCSPTLANRLLDVFQTGASISCLFWRTANIIPTNVSWGRLYRLRLNGMYTPDDIYNVVRECDGVCELSINCINGDVSAQPRSTMVLAKLQHLSIHSYVNLKFLFDVISLPSLVSVTLHHRFGAGTPRNPESFGGMLDRSGCQLEKFVIWDVAIDDGELAQYLRLSGLNSLTEIHIQQPRISEATLRLFSPQIGPWTLPSLQDIHLGRCGTSDGAMENALSARLASGGQQVATLRCVEVGLDQSHKLDRAYLDSLRTSDVQVNYY